MDSFIWCITCGLCGSIDTDEDDIQQPLIDEADPSNQQGSSSADNIQRQPTPVSTKNILGLGQRDVHEDYEIGRLLGQGAYAIVCEAHNRRTGDRYACKTILKTKMKRKADVEDVRREVQILMMLSGHVNIASLVGIYEDEVAVHVILEYCEGGELIDDICSRGTHSERDAARFFRSMVNVVQHCHTLGIMHRDIKPENFLLSTRGSNGVVKAADFGLSQFFRPGKNLHSLVGSAHFVAPEVVGRDYSPAADVWSLGVSLYMLLTGLTPFWGDTEEEVLEMVLHAPLDFETEPWPLISKQAKDIVKRMMDRNPAKRPTPTQLLQHPFCRVNSVPDKPLPSIVVERMRSIASAVKVKRAAMLAATQGHVLPQYLPKLHALFRQLDVDKSGSLSADKLKLGLQRLKLPLPHGGVDALVQSADKDGDGVISLTEFLAICLEAAIFDESAAEDIVVSQMESDAEGRVTNEEIQSVLNRYGVTEEDMKAIISALDKNGQGFVKISTLSAWMASHTTNLKDASLRTANQ